MSDRALGRTMRAALLTLLLLAPFAATAQAHAGHAMGLDLTDLRLLFDPVTASQQFHFHLKNNDTGKTGSLFASVTFVDDSVPSNNVRVSGNGLLPAEEGDFFASVAGRASLRGCIFVYGTAVNEPPKASNRECEQSSGLSAFPFELPLEVPAVTQLP